MRRLRMGTACFGIAVLAMLISTPAGAGGSWLSPVQHFVEPGDEVTFVGYVGRGQLGWVEDGPFFAYLRAFPEEVKAELNDDSPWPFVHESDISLGIMDITDRGNVGYLSLRISVTFTVPGFMEAGRYPIVYCNKPCTDGIGDLIGADLVVGSEWVGCHEWAFDDPAIADLPAGADVCGPGGSGTAAEILAGLVTQSPNGTVTEGGSSDTLPPIRRVSASTTSTSPPTTPAPIPATTVDSGQPSATVSQVVPGTSRLAPLLVGISSAAILIGVAVMYRRRSRRLDSLK